MMAYKWTLRKGGRKERCPQCGKLRFVPFVLTDDPSVKAGREYGRCDREQSCGYFRYPGRDVKCESDRKHIPEPPKEPILFPPDIALCDVGISANSLFRAYAAIFGTGGLLANVMTAYMCGTGGRGECIYNQFDGTHVRTAKAIMYGKGGHRLKVEDGGLPVWWLHKSPAMRQYTEGRELKQCFFGQHLLRICPNADVYVVEGEKTAVLMAALDSMRGKAGRLWIACGGSQMLKGAIDLMPLVGRRVTLIPDDGQYWNWVRVANTYGWECHDIEPRKKALGLPDGCDIWDIAEIELKGGRK